MSLLSILATIFGAMAGLANVPQIIKIFKRKSAKDISILTYTILSIGALIWILYGIEIMNVPILVMNTVALTCFISVIFGWFKYGR